MDVAHLARHGVSQADAVRADPAQQSRADAAGPRPTTSADAAGRSRGTGRDERKGRLSLDIERRGRGVHPARVPSLRNPASLPAARGSEGSPGILSVPRSKDTGRRWVDVSRHRPEFVSVMNDAGLAFLTQFPERGLDLHSDLDVLRLDIDQLRGEPEIGRAHV